MAFLTINGVRVAGVSAAVPSHVEPVRLLHNLFTKEEVEKFIAATGVESRHTSTKLLSSDLCTAAADKMISDLGWKKSSIDGLIVVTQCPDYTRPSNATLIQYRLGLSKECAAYCITFGCSGWIYGMQAAAALVSLGLKRVLLCCGEGIQAYCPEDKSTYPLFGSAGTCTALEADANARPIHFHLATDGGGWKAIHCPDGGYRNPCSADSYKIQELDGGIRRTRMNTALDGMDVFTFGISQPPKSIKALCEHFGIDMSTIDYLLLHQANLFLNEKIMKKVGMPAEKCPHNIEEFGNSSSGTLPLLMVTRLKDAMCSKRLDMIGCAFGVGLSWGSVAFSTDSPIVSDLVFVEDDYAAVFA